MAWPCLPAAVKAPLILRLLSLTGLLICGYLAGLKLAGKTSSLAGCGQGSGCGNVLGSEWPQLFGIPVSLLAFVIYLALLIASFRLRDRSTELSQFVLPAPLSGLSGSSISP